MCQTDHGKFSTPAFMPVGTIGTVKTLSPKDLLENDVQIILSNTYHLYLKPGLDILQAAGGIHRFNGWDGPILTDSGGFQVYSLDELRKISDEGVQFKSHWDGSLHFFTPEKVVDIQRIIGSDIMMVLDHCIANPSEKEVAHEANLRTIRWAERSRKYFLETEEIYDFKQSQFGIVQGGLFTDLRRESISVLRELDFEGYAIGGLAVGENAEQRNEITDFCSEYLPVNKPRYLMGVGKPLDILEAIERGVDMFDCVIPTRNARNGTVFTENGKLVIRNSRYKADFDPIEPDCGCFSCRNFSRSYIRHLLNVNEVLGLRLTTIHNIYFYQKLIKQAREQILTDSFLKWKKGFTDRYREGIIPR